MHSETYFLTLEYMPVTPSFNAVITPPTSEARNTELPAAAPSIERQAAFEIPRPEPLMELLPTILLGIGVAYALGFLTASLIPKSE